MFSSPYTVSFLQVKFFSGYLVPAWSSLSEPFLRCLVIPAICSSRGAGNWMLIGNSGSAGEVCWEFYMGWSATLTWLKNISIDIELLSWLVRTLQTLAHKQRPECQHSWGWRAQHAVYKHSLNLLLVFIPPFPARLEVFSRKRTFQSFDKDTLEKRRGSGMPTPNLPLFKPLQGSPIADIRSQGSLPVVVRQSRPDSSMTRSN